MVTIEYREAAGRSSAMRSKNIINGFTAFYNYFSLEYHGALLQ